MKLLLIIYLSGIAAGILSMLIQNIYVWVTTPKDIRTTLWGFEGFGDILKMLCLSWICAIGLWWKWKGFVAEHKNTNRVFRQLQKVLKPKP